MTLEEWYDGEIPQGAETPLSMLVLQPTPFCNIACNYCYLSDTGNTARMSPGVISSTCERLAESGFVSGPLKILWHAGEPLVVGTRFYQDAFEQLRRELPPAIKPSHSFQTNGTLLTSEFAELLKAWSVNVGISLDGPAHIHDSHRVSRSGGGTHEMVMAGVRLLQAHGIPFTVICVVSEQSLSHGAEIMHFFGSIGVREVGFNVEEVEGSHATSSLDMTEASLQHFRSFILEVYYTASEHDIKIREFEQVRRYVLRDGSIYSTLQNPFSIISIDWQGNFCTFSPELLTDPLQRFILGNVFKHSFWAAAGTPRYSQIRHDIVAGREACRSSCAYFDVCGGGCPSNKMYERNSFRATETTQCRYIRQVIGDVLIEKLEEELGIAVDGLPVSPDF